MENFAISLESCTSGHVDQMTFLTSSTLNVYMNDEQCVAKLNEVQIGGVVYRVDNPGAVNFISWTLGDVATLTNDDGSQQISVIVGAQLSNPITSDDNINYVVYDISEGGVHSVSDTIVSEIRKDGSINRYPQ